MADQPTDDRSPYRGSQKHKARPSDGVKGTRCPEWSHATPAGGLEYDMFRHSWRRTEAHELFVKSEESPAGSGKRYATAHGVAFVAKETNDGTWHGYPVPWVDVPVELKNKWQDQGLVHKRDLRHFWDRPKSDIDWAMETDE